MQVCINFVKESLYGKIAGVVPRIDIPRPKVDSRVRGTGLTKLEVLEVGINRGLTQHETIVLSNIESKDKYKIK